MPVNAHSQSHPNRKPQDRPVRRASLEAGALGCSISGAGPTMFAWALEPNAPAVLSAMRTQFARAKIEADEWIVEIQPIGARIVESA